MTHKVNVTIMINVQNKPIKHANLNALLFFGPQAVKLYEKNYFPVAQVFFAWMYWNIITFLSVNSNVYQEAKTTCECEILIAIKINIQVICITAF